MDTRVSDRGIMTRTDPPNPPPGTARPPLTDAEHQALTEHLANVAGGANLALVALSRTVGQPPRISRA
ncbi:hypothetical protein MXD62_07010, partial [Frankia sp. Mgl5]|uniref:hypothetical protein n=1 Tax=Frankia sp. Mgl5 TaxID=2933793 RepID=UPI002010056A